MHFLTYVFVRDDSDIDTAVATALHPYSDDFPVKPWKRYLNRAEIDAMAKHYRLPASEPVRLAQHMNDWCRAEGGIDLEGLFAVMTCNPDTKFDWYEIGGRWHGKLKDDRAPVRALLGKKDLEAFSPHDFLTPDGVWHAKSRYVPGDELLGHLVEKSRSIWLAEFRKALRRHQDCFVVVVDRHD